VLQSQPDRVDRLDDPSCLSITIRSRSASSPAAAPAGTAARFRWRPPRGQPHFDLRLVAVADSCISLSHSTDCQNFSTGDNRPAQETIHHRMVRRKPAVPGAARM
jgi:hypothetical protein